MSGFHRRDCARPFETAKSQNGEGRQPQREPLSFRAQIGLAYFAIASDLFLARALYVLGAGDYLAQLSESSAFGHRFKPEGAVFVSGRFRIRKWPISTSTAWEWELSGLTPGVPVQN